ncbi:MULTISPECIES: branched-chain amino acid ABC transporter permease [unclassified Mesorhizobium]|uniref:branched-chain amino acid ABC transporter permease n=1 Tax=unclassified Mesorhizobium TaxID=325217 RepID=UPI00333A3D8A
MLISTLILNGLVMGAIYALIGVGLSLIFGVLEIVNFAHGQIYALGALALAVLVGHFGFGFLPAALVSALAVAAFGYVLYVLFLRHIKKGEFERGIILTLGIGIVLQNALIYLYGATPQIVDTEFSFKDISFLGFRVEVIKAIAVGFAIVSITLLHLVLTRTRFGMAIRALSQNREAALVVGMRPTIVAGHAVIIGMALAGLAGAVLAPVFTVHPLMGGPILFKAFAIVIIGGLGHLPGAVVASLIIGVSESLAGGLGSASLQDAAVFLVMIAMLQFRPIGLFGKGVRI